MDVANPQYAAPTVQVFDSQSDAISSNAITPHIVTPQFCIFFNYPGSAKPPSPIQPYSPALAALVNYVKAEGTIPIYASNL